MTYAPVGQPRWLSRLSTVPSVQVFYGTVLGLRELPRPAFDFEGTWYALSDRQLHLIVHPPARTLRKTVTIDRARRPLRTAGEQL